MNNYQPPNDRTAISKLSKQPAVATPMVQVLGPAFFNTKNKKDGIANEN
ncbi:hypothetical protein [Schleiferilactobacillus harbinensis]|nr:hypothetical protein [Schleiferilactobacillus harbinensis]